MADLDFSTYSAMPDLQKKQICLDLLTEFGADEIHETAKGELQHRCTLPLDGHSDRDSMTASINYKKLTFKCFVCGNSGGLLWWIAVNRHESSTQARTWLRDASGITDGIPTENLLAILDSLFNRQAEDRVMPSYDARAIARWTSWPMFHPYMTGPWAQSCREIPEENLRQFNIGYCDSDDDWRYYQRIIIPIYWDSKLVGWQARKLAKDDPEPAKYKFSPDVPRERILYATPETLKQRDTLIVIEGNMGVLRHCHHLPVAATMGASVSPNQLPLLHKYSRVILMLDNDKAGWDAQAGTFNKRGKQLKKGLIEELRPFTEVRVVQSPYGSIVGRTDQPEGAPDAADFTDEEIEALVDESVPAVRWTRPDPTELVSYQRIAVGATA